MDGVLHGMVGQDNVKDAFEELLTGAEIDQLRRAEGLQVPSLSRHMILAGPPGTGKTTVARAISEAFWALGLVPTRKYMEIENSSELINPIVGKTPEHVREVFGRAKGGVLFVDEFYGLIDSANNGGYGGEALTELLTLMENNRHDTVVIFGGYGERVEDLYRFNPGFRGRFDKTIEFDPYTREELGEILPGMAEKMGFKLSPAAAERAEEFVAGIGPRENARGVRSVLQRAKARLDARVASLPDDEKTAEVLQTFEPVDFFDGAGPYDDEG